MSGWLAYRLLHLDPTIVYLVHLYRPDAAFRHWSPLLHTLGPCHALCSWWWHPDDRELDAHVEAERRYRRAHPEHLFVHLCSDRTEVQRVVARGLSGVLCSHNAFVNERIYRPLGARRVVQAVYDARLASYKRHQLASELTSLMLLIRRDRVPRDHRYEAAVRSIVEHAITPNFMTGKYVNLAPTTINYWLNRCRIGLCLSAGEGAMYAAIQYLLAGLPVVSTPNVGGRDAFRDDRTWLETDGSSVSVRDAVTELDSRELSPMLVRHRALEKISGHRENFVAMCQTLLSRGHHTTTNARLRARFGNRLFKWGSTSAACADARLARDVGRVADSPLLISKTQ